MWRGNNTQSLMFNGSLPSSQQPGTISGSTRSLRKNQLGGVIFGCKNSTIKECMFKQIFGLPAQHFSFVKNIDPGLPLFLFNYSDRKLHGIFEAASPGQMNINPYGWTKDGSEKTLYPAQVQIRVRMQCLGLNEDQFKSIIADNYYTQNHFWFEMDHAQANKLISKFSSTAAFPSTSSLPPNTVKWGKLFCPLPSPTEKEDGEQLNQSELWASLGNFDQSSTISNSTEEKSLEDHSLKHAVIEDEDPIYLKLKELALNQDNLTSSSNVNDEEIVNTTNGVNEDGKCQNEENNVTHTKNEEIPIFSYDTQLIIAQLTRDLEDLKAFKESQIRKTNYLEQRLAEAEEEIKHLKDHCMIPSSGPSIVRVDETMTDSVADNLDPSEMIYLVGGYDGLSWISSLDVFSPINDVIKPLQPMSSVRSFASVSKLNDELYIYGGGNGEMWYDTVESYNPATDQWTPRPCLNASKGSLAGVTLGDKIFVVGGGNGAECFADVEMFDADLGKWILTRSMLQKRFALGAAELNGILYVTGGYDGNGYLNSAERFDPREHSWTKIESMNTKRGCHSLVALNEKLYALGGFDGDAMIPSVEIYDPRFGTWTMGEPMDQPRGYSSAVVLKDSIYVTGGLLSSDTIIETVEKYEENRGWQVQNLKAIGRRCYFSAIVL